MHVLINQWHPTAYLHDLITSVKNGCDRVQAFFFIADAIPTQLLEFLRLAMIRNSPIQTGFVFLITVQLSNLIETL